MDKCWCARVPMPAASEPLMILSFRQVVVNKLQKGPKIDKYIYQSREITS